jgi:arylsulfatase
VVSTRVPAGLTVADAVAGYAPDARPPAGAPNVVVVVLDDTGFAQLGCFGSDIDTPHIDRLGAGGLRYNRFHVTSLCSPTRAAFLTGRNHHAVGMGFLADIPLAYPGYTARLPRSAAPLPALLRAAGYSTWAVGKWHLTPRGHRSVTGPFDTWPLGTGFERYYGFLQGDANHWGPNLVEDNHYVDPPPAGQGYHLSEDLGARAVRHIVDQQNAAPAKPFFLYLAFGAMHAPHHVAAEWSDRYRGRFDQGWDAWREQAFARQLAAGVVPEGTVLTLRPSWVDAWDDLSPDERRMQARQQEVFAGFLTHTDAQIGRVVDALERYGLLDDTLIMLFSDNGASAEGGRLGSVNEHRFTARIRDTVEEQLAAYDDWGGPGTYNHYSWAWAWAGNTPLRLWKRYTWLGGTRTPLIVHWPRGTTGAGAVRQQFAHVVDLAPTVLDAVGLSPPAVHDGVTQQPVDGASLRPTFTDAAAPDPRQTQYFEMLGSRSIVHRGWKATTDFISTGVVDEEERATGSRRFEDDHWSLFDLRNDFSESTDKAAEHPELVRTLQELWLAEAGRNQVLPIDGTLVNRLGALIPPAWPSGRRRTFRPGGGPIADEAIPALLGGFRITAVVDVPETDAEGVIFALGDRHGGYALYVVAGRALFTFSRAGEALEVEATEPVPSGRVEVGVSYVLGEAMRGTFTLLYDDRPVGVSRLSGMLPVAMQHGGAGLRLGVDAGFAVSDRYAPPAPFNGAVREVTVDTPGSPPPDPDEEVRAALHSD